MPKNWNRRFKHNRDKIKTGDIYELAEVVRNLAIREHEKGLSTGEKQMFTRAKKILASELMYALEMDEEEAEDHLDDLLTESALASPQRRQALNVAVALIVAAGQWRTPWRRPAQGVRRPGGPPDARVERRGAAGGGDRGDRRRAAAGRLGAARLRRRGRRRDALGVRAQRAAGWRRRPAIRWSSTTPRARS